MIASSDSPAKKFPGSFRIKKSEDFEYIKENATKIFAKHFLVLVSKTNADNCRLGITITTKIDKRAVVRNKLKRRIRNIFRLNRYKLKAKLDIVVIARNGAPTCSYSEIEAEIIGALNQRGFLKK